MRDSDIHAMVRLVQTAITRWKEPVLGVIASQSHDPFQVLIACILSLRTKDQTTADAANRLFALGSTPAALSTLPVPTIEHAIYPVGFYRTKARNIHRICLKLLADHHGQVPLSMEELLALPGVGRKTANLVLTVGHGKPGICVDIHVHRICNRWGYVNSRQPDHTEMLLRQKLPKQYWINFNDWLVPFGQNLCRPISPFCSQCPVRTFCRRVGVTSSR